MLCITSLLTTSKSGKSDPGIAERLYVPEEDVTVNLVPSSLPWNETCPSGSALIISAAFFAGIAGGLYAHYINYIDPDSFTVMELIPVLCIVIIGGLGSLKGTLIATFVLVLLPEPLRFIGFSSDVIGPARQIIYAVLLICILIYRPKGLYGRFDLK